MAPLKGIMAHASNTFFVILNGVKDLNSWNTQDSPLRSE
jgi:hypothetical protein